MLTENNDIIASELFVCTKEHSLEKRLALISGVAVSKKEGRGRIPRLQMVNQGLFGYDGACIFVFFHVKSWYCGNDSDSAHCSCVMLSSFE